MAQRDTTPKQTALRRYIVGRMFPECKEEPLPLGEVALAKKFGITRLTVQRACKDLVADHSLIRIPGRRGLFVNPDFARMRGHRRFFGIVTAPCTETIIEIPTFNLISGFSEVMQDVNGDFQFITLSSGDAEAMAEELLSYPLSGIVWILPQGNSIIAFEKVIKAGRPAVALMPIWKQNPHPATNTVLPDKQAIGNIRAETVLRSGCSRPGYFAHSKHGSFPSFCMYLKQQKITFDESNFIRDSEEFFPELASLVNDGMIDSLVADGNIYPHMRDIYNKIPGIRQIKLFVDDNPWTRHIAEEMPGLRIEFFPFHTGDHHREIGRLGGCLLRQLLDQGGAFENQTAAYHASHDPKPYNKER